MTPPSRSPLFGSQHDLSLRQRAQDGAPSSVLRALRHTSFRFCACLLIAGLCMALAGCRDDEHADDGHKHEPGEEHAERAPDSGFQQEMGVFVSESTKATLDVQTTAAIEKTLPQRAEGTARIYAPGKATAMLDSASATALAPGHCVSLGADRTFTGTLARIDRQLETSLGQVEVLIEFNGANVEDAIGKSLPMTFDIATTKPAPAVPESSVLQTGEGSFLFVAKDGHFRRTRVEPSARADGWVQLAGGVNAGDMIVTKGVQRLWCIELQATKAGTACCPVSDK